MAKPSFWTEQNKKKVAAGAVLICGFLIIYEFFLSGGPSPPRQGSQSSSGKPSPTPAAAVTPVPKSTPTVRPDSAAAKEALLQQQLSDITPLMPTAHKPAPGAETERGNIFAYFVPTPTPPLPPPSPPPILLRYAQPQTAVAGTPRPFTLVVMGDHFPADPQIIFGGVPKPTKKSEGALAAEIAASDYAFSRTVPIEVKSQSKPAESYSNSISFVVQAPPQIPFKMVGRIGDLAVLEVPGVPPNKEYLRLRKGNVAMQFWRIDSMDATGIDVTDTRYDIKTRVRLEEKH